MSPRDEPAAALLGGVALLERAITYNLGCLHGVEPASLHRPTPCAAWDLCALLRHLDDSLHALGEAADLGRIDLDSALSAPTADPGGSGESAQLVTAVRDRTRGLLGTWTNGPDVGSERVALGHDSRLSLSSGVVACAGALELTVHGWDIAVATGRRRPIPAPLADELLDLTALLVTDADRPERFAEQIPQPATAGPGERLLGFLGRRS